MARPNSLMEWIDQTKKLSKAVDYMAMDQIDSIRKVLTLVRKKTLIKNKEFFDYYCKHYHKPNPINLSKGIRTIESQATRLVSGYVCESIKLVEGLRKCVLNQWFEVIDFMYERPELINPSIVNDDYIKTQIDMVCSDGKKNNPFKDGASSKFGKYYRGSNGRWFHERRKRF